MMANRKVIIGVVTVILIAIGVGVGVAVSGGNIFQIFDQPSNATPVITGTSQSVSITQDNLKDEGGGSVRTKFTYTIQRPGVPYIAIHFAKFDFSRECTMELSDQHHLLVVEYTDKGKKNLGKFWARHVEGEKLHILVYCLRGAGDNKAIFEIDEIVYGLTDNDMLMELEEPSQREEPSRRQLRAEELFPFDSNRHRSLTLCGEDDGKNAICYKDSHPDEYNVARAVARLQITGKGTCTGWLVGPNNLLFTNNHCIESQADVDNTDFQFMAEGTSCSASKTSTGRFDVYDGGELVTNSFSKDYALVRLSGDPVTKYG